MSDLARDYIPDECTEKTTDKRPAPTSTSPNASPKRRRFQDVETQTTLNRPAPAVTHHIGNARPNRQQEVTFPHEMPLARKKSQKRKSQSNKGETLEVTKEGHERGRCRDGIKCVIQWMDSLEWFASCVTLMSLNRECRSLHESIHQRRVLRVSDFTPADAIGLTAKQWRDFR
jgi:hypothetical protein